MDLTPHETRIAKAVDYIGFKSANQMRENAQSDEVEDTIDLLVPISLGETTMHATGAELGVDNPNYLIDIEPILHEIVS